MNRIRTARLTRREFLSRAIAGALVIPHRSLFALGGATQFPFELVPPEKSGIRWVHDAAHSPDKYLPESSGPGCAFLDYDNDGWMDIYLVNSGKCDFFTPKTPLRNALYKNNRDGTFTDVTEKAGVIGGGFGQGVAVGDYDGDGFPDIYVTQYGSSILYHNNGDGTFTDVTAKAGVAAPGWASAAVWFDYDNDGRLDLFVARFADFTKELNKPCGIHEDGLRHYCIPKAYAPMASWLFHNNGDGTFTDVSKESGIASHLGKAWGVVATDINNDGRMDLFVSNDTVPNFLYVNHGNGKFEEIGEIAGIAYSADGLARSGMGVDSADVDQDGYMDLYVANINYQDYSLYRNNHDETFDDDAGQDGIASSTYLMSGWGLKFFDFDNDGNLDLFQVDGHPDDLIDQQHLQVTYAERPMLFQWNGKGFTNISAHGGPVFSQPLAARGLAIGDFNNDGATDVLIGVNDGAPVLVQNIVGAQNHWLGIKLVGTKSNRDAVGARITYQAQDLKRSRMKVGGGSFLSSHDPRMVLGIGKRERVDWVEIKWPLPSGKIERLTDLPIDRYITVVEGQGKWT